MRRHHPDYAGSSGLVVEQSRDYRDTYQTVSRQVLGSLVDLPGSKLVLITGDAGHGKTSMCLDLLEDLGVPKTEAHDALQRDTRAETVLAHTPSGRPLRVVMDLSYFSQETAGELLENLFHTDDDVTVVCANEGHLRAAISTLTDDLMTPALDILRSSDATGRISDDLGQIYVINLNYQSVLQGFQPQSGFINWALADYLDDDSEWAICNQCDARDICPILETRNQLTDVLHGPGRRNAIAEVFRAVEESGVVVTFRHALMLLSYALSGGMDCSRIQSHFDQDPTDRTWQYQHLYHQAIFGDLLDDGIRSAIPALEAARLLDPGYTSIRSVDDQFDIADLPRMRPPDPRTLHQSMRTTAHRRQYEESVRAVFVYLRRAAFFDADRPDRLRRLGLENGEVFQDLLEGSDLTESLSTKLIAGLESAQGIPGLPGTHPLRVVDPAFYSEQSTAAVLSRELSPGNISVRVPLNLSPERDSEWQLSDTVEWSPRRIDLVLRIPGANHVTIPLGMIEFELLSRWSEGLSCRVQHEEVVRKLLAHLGHVPPPPLIDSDDLRLIVNGAPLTLDFANGRFRSWN